MKKAWARIAPSTMGLRTGRGSMSSFDADRDQRGSQEPPPIPPPTPHIRAIHSSLFSVRSLYLMAGRLAILGRYEAI